MFNILLCRIDTNKPTKPGDPIPFKNVCTIATAETEDEALRTAQYYSRLYQSKGLYHVIHKPTHIVTYAPA